MPALMEIFSEMVKELVTFSLKLMVALRVVDVVPDTVLVMVPGELLTRFCAASTS